MTRAVSTVPQQAPYRAPTDRIFYMVHTCQPACLNRVRPSKSDVHRGKNPLLTPLLYDFRRMIGRRKVNRKVHISPRHYSVLTLALMLNAKFCFFFPTLVPPSSPSQMFFHVIYKAPCGLCLRNMPEIQNYLFLTQCDFIFLEMFCLDPYVLVDRRFQPQKPCYYIPDITDGKEDIPLSCVNEIDSTPPPDVAYSEKDNQNLVEEKLFGFLCCKVDKTKGILLEYVCVLSSR